MTSVDLRGTRLRLRDFQAEDITPAYLQWLNDSEVVRFSNQRFRHHDRASCLDYLASFSGSANLFVSIRMAEDDRGVGTMTAYRNPHHGTADIGIMVGDRTVWGTGIGQEAWNLLTDWLLTETDVRKVTAGTLACNLAMIRLAERSGMLLEGRRIAQEIVEGTPHDILYFGKFRA